MGNPNSKKHKANHAGYRVKPSQAAVKANLNFWSTLKNEAPVENVLVDDELDELFSGASAAEKLIEIGTQLKLF